MITIQLIKTEQITGLRHKNLGFKEVLCRKGNHVTYDNIDKCRVLCKMKLDTLLIEESYDREKEREAYCLHLLVG